MTRALFQAQAGDAMFGAVLVCKGEIVARAHNPVAQTGDPSAYAELNLIRTFCQQSGLRLLAGYTLYTTAEPCPMCAALCSFTGVSKIYGVSVADLTDLSVPQINLSCEEVVSRGAAKLSTSRLSFGQTPKLNPTNGSRERVPPAVMVRLEASASLKMQVGGT